MTYYIFNFSFCNPSQLECKLFGVRYSAHFMYGFILIDKNIVQK